VAPGVIARAKMGCAFADDDGKKITLGAFGARIRPEEANVSKSMSDR
jgi:hypothetical protein